MPPRHRPGRRGSPARRGGRRPGSRVWCHPGPSLARVAQSLESQRATAERLDRVIGQAHSELRMLDARLDEAVARTLELSAPRGRRRHCRGARDRRRRPGGRDGIAPPGPGGDERHVSPRLAAARRHRAKCPRPSPPPTRASSSATRLRGRRWPLRRRPRLPNHVSVGARAARGRPIPSGTTARPIRRHARQLAVGEAASAAASGAEPRPGLEYSPRSPPWGPPSSTTSSV